MSEELVRSRAQLFVWIRWVAVVVIAGALCVVALTLPLGPMMEALAEWLEQFGIWAPVLFSLIYIAATILLIPGPTLAIAAGAMFHFATAVAIVSVSNTVGAMTSFLIARYLARMQIANFAHRHPKFEAIDQAIGHGSWKFVALLRLAVGLPFNLENYLLGLTAIRFWPCLWASFFSMIPGTMLYVYIGYVVGIVANGGEEQTIVRWIMLGIGLLATIALTWYMVRLARQEMGQHADLDKAEADEQALEQQAAQTSGFPWGTSVLCAVALALLLVASATWYQQHQLTEMIEHHLAEREHPG